jgi:hypothetical protein
MAEATLSADLLALKIWWDEILRGRAEFTIAGAQEFSGQLDRSLAKAMLLEDQAAATEHRETAFANLARVCNRALRMDRSVAEAELAAVATALNDAVAQVAEIAPGEEAPSNVVPFRRPVYCEVPFGDGSVA